MRSKGIPAGLPEILTKKGALVYFVGIKGTGMCALAELLYSSGLNVSGSDGASVFYTDAILKEMGIPYHECFDAAQVPAGAELVIHSAAYNETNPEIAETLRRGIPLLKYPDALGEYSRLFDSSGIAGVHGKTTTTAMAGILFRAAALPARVLAGSAVPAFGGRSTFVLGDKYFAAETCEYRRHFLAFHPRRIILTSIESDHQDFFPTYESIRDAFADYIQKLPPGGVLIYCADNPGAAEAAEALRKKRTDLRFIPYGFNASGPFQIKDAGVEDERMVFSLAGFEGPWRLSVPGRHNVLNAAAALALTTDLVKAEGGKVTADTAKPLKAALESFSGSRRRSEILGEEQGILFMDDYGHHPTAIRTTLEGLKEFYPRRRLVVSFMSHTYSRTAALLDDFAQSLIPADLLFLHRIYASAREQYQGGVDGKTLYETTKAVFEKNGRGDCVFYIDDPGDAAAELEKILACGDLFITLGAGDNFRLGQKLLRCYRGRP